MYIRTIKNVKHIKQNSKMYLGHASIFLIFFSFWVFQHFYHISLSSKEPNSENIDRKFMWKINDKY
jgi:hypothetical protein